MTTPVRFKTRRSLHCFGRDQSEGAGWAAYQCGFFGLPEALVSRGLTQAAVRNGKPCETEVVERRPRRAQFRKRHDGLARGACDRHRPGASSSFGADATMLAGLERGIRTRDDFRCVHGEPERLRCGIGRIEWCQAVGPCPRST
jgi:hypothetical protein